MINDRNTCLTMAIQPAESALKMTEEALRYADGNIDKMNLQLIVERLAEAVEMLKQESRGITK